MCGYGLLVTVSNDSDKRISSFLSIYRYGQLMARYIVYDIGENCSKENQYDE